LFGLVRLTKRSQKPKMVMTKITSSPSVRYEERYRQWMAPLLAAISESLTPTYPFKEVGLGRSPYQRTGQAVMFAAAPTSQHFVALSNSFRSHIRRASAHFTVGPVCPSLLLSRLKPRRVFKPFLVLPLLADTSETPPLPSRYDRLQGLRAGRDGYPARRVLLY